MLTTRLKDDNWALHQIAERQDTPGSMIKGTMPIDGYHAMLAQQYFINSVFDDAIESILPDHPQIAEIVLEEQLLTPYIIDDMHYFEIDPQSTQTAPGTQRFIDHIEAHKDQALHMLGLHYVRLGACNGNTFVARVVRKAYSLDDQTQGTRYLDPFGTSQRTKWLAFKNGLDAMDLTQDQQDQVFAGTRAAYVNAINLDLPEHKSDEQLLAEHEKNLDQKAFVEGHSVHVTPELEN